MVHVAKTPANWGREVIGDSKAMGAATTEIEAENTGRTRCLRGRDDRLGSKEVWKEGGREMKSKNTERKAHARMGRSSAGVETAREQSF